MSHPKEEAGEPERQFKLGDPVRKTKGSSWQGAVVGFYSTDLTPVGYCVESERERGSVQLYPEAALEPVFFAAPTAAPMPMFIMCESCGSMVDDTQVCDCTKMGVETQRLIGLYRGAPPAPADTEIREALKRLIETYKDMQDGDGNPCPDVAFARDVLNGGEHG